MNILKYHITLKLPTRFAVYSPAYSWLMLVHYCDKVAVDSPYPHIVTSFRAALSGFLRCDWLRVIVRRFTRLAVTFPVIIQKFIKMLS